MIAIVALASGLLLLSPPAQAAVTRTGHTHAPTQPTIPAALRTVSVFSAAELQTAITNALPGDYIRIASGTYTNIGLITIPTTKSGTAAHPIRIMANSTYGAVFTGTSAFNVTADYIIISGIKFSSANRSGNSCCITMNGNFGRVTDCQFYDSGDANNHSRHMISLIGTSSYNRIDSCFFSNSKSIPIGQLTEGPHHNTIVKNNIDGNTAGWGSSDGAMICIGQTFTSHASYTTVEYNTVQNVATNYAIGIKGNHSILRYNKVFNCDGAGTGSRCGSYNIIQGNVTIDSCGFQAMTDHGLICDNYVRASAPRTNTSFVLLAVSPETYHMIGNPLVRTLWYNAVTDTTIRDNVLINQSTTSGVKPNIAESNSNGGTDIETHANGNTFNNNTLVNKVSAGGFVTALAWTSSAILDITFIQENTWTNNKFWRTDGTTTLPSGIAGGGNVIYNPNLNYTDADPTVPLEDIPFL